VVAHIMKTQLLEDIGQSATLSLVPSGKVSNSTADEAEPHVAQALAAMPVRPRSAVGGVWRQKAADEPVALATQQPDQQPAEPIAAVEAEPEPPQPVPEAVIPRAEPTPAASAPQDPLFDFTSPWSTTPAPVPDLSKREPTWFERSGRRDLIWGSCMLSVALVILAGLWFYEERKDASALALVADEVKVEVQVDKAVKPRAIAAKEFTLGADGEVRVTAAPPPSPVPRTAPTVPPLVLLEPKPATDTKDRQQLQAPPMPERARATRPPDRQLALAPVMQAERKPAPESAMAATLKACREYGYHEAQCVKRGCTVTKYGFVCRGK
jgi:hypothetical protein